MPSCQSVIVVAVSYHQPLPIPCGVENSNPAEESEAVRGRVAMYAWGDDYHEVLRGKLGELIEALRSNLAIEFECRACVDTSPVLEREWAAASGLGWIGKNTLVLNPELGSYFFLGVILTTLDLAPDEPAEDHCGTCTACLEACPTAAFPAAYQMDASRCVSYLTIEHRGDIDPALQAGIGDWLFGCDICQEVCPHNRRAAFTREPRFAIRFPSPFPQLSEILSWSEDDYRKHLKNSSMKRAKLGILHRNAGIVKINARNSDPM